MIAEAVVAKKVPVEEFKKDISSYLDGAEVLHLTRNGRVVAVYSPLTERDADWEEFRRLRPQVDARLAEAGIDDEELESILQEFKQERKLKKAG